MADFHNVRLPDEIEQGAHGGPTFSTNVTSISSGAEQRNSLWDRARLQWDVGYGIQSQADYQDILSFFYARRGKAYGFLFKDWSDFSATDELIGVGNSINRIFRLRKNYHSGSESFPRAITHPIGDTIELKVDNVLVSESDYTVDPFGIIRFDVGHAPTLGQEITWSGEFDVPVRFDVDDFDLTLSALASGTVSALPIIEIREQLNSPPSDIEITTTYLSDIDENASTATRIKLCDFYIVDDDLGINEVGVGGDNPTYFEVELNVDNRTGSLYLKAGAQLDFETFPSLEVTIDAWDTVIGERPSATVLFTLDVNDVAEPPVITLTNEVHALALGTSTASRVKLADIATTADMGQTVTLSLTGADASHFEIFGGDLYLKSGENTASVHHYTVTIVATPSIASASSVAFALSIGITAGEQIYDATGDYTFPVPEYATLSIEVQSAGCGSWGYTPGSPVAPNIPGITYVRNDQTVTALERWTVQASLSPSNPDAWTPASNTVTAKQDSSGIGSALLESRPGINGGVGIAAGNKAASYDVASGQGGYATDEDGNIMLGGASVRASTPSPGGVTVAHGQQGQGNGSGASGGVYKKLDVLAAGFTTSILSPELLTFASMAGASSGNFAKYNWTFGSAQIGSDENYKASAPAVGSTLYIKIGSGGLGGLGTVNGANGRPGRVRISWS